MMRPGTFFFNHAFGRVLRAEIQAPPVHGRHAVEVFGRGVQKIDLVADAGVVHQQVDAGEEPVDFGVHGGDILHLAHVGIDGLRPHAHGPRPVAHLPCGLFIAVIVDGQIISAGGQLQGDGAADSPGGACDDRNGMGHRNFPSFLNRLFHFLCHHYRAGDARRP